ncbi:protein Spindly-like [Xyrauchen texanus]|uniref:protein Spindly-like n=1 Tax=Xyrauchen texanus TaxID=154827 RepID=UPI00224255AD|nr:protein Spindly-like [Xyrauchen texanus]
MASSKSRNIVIACLALWSIISLIIIVVWTTSSDMKLATECRTEMRALTESHEEEKIMWTKDRKALDELVRQGWGNQTFLQNHIDQYKEQLRFLNKSLVSSLQENAFLNSNITFLESKIEEYRIIEGNLTAEVSLQKDQIEALEHNLTLKAHELVSCEALQIAVQQLQTVAEKQTQACETSKQNLQKLLTNCKNLDQNKHEAVEYHLNLNDNNAAQGTTTRSITLVAILCLSLLFVQ